MSAIVNVLDFEAVPGTDCSDAFQRAVDSLHPQLGGTVKVPGSSLPYKFSRSVLVDRHNVRIVGEGPSATVLQGTAYTPPLIFGVARQPLGRQVSDGHWADLFGLLDTKAAPSAGKCWGFRTRVPSPVEGQPPSDATLTFPCSPFQFGPRKGNYWTGVRKLTLDFVVRNDQMPWAGQPLFGMVDAYHHPCPFFAQVSVLPGEPRVLFVFRTTDGLTREIRVPFDSTRDVLRCSLQIDLDAATVAAWTDRVQVAPDLAMINDGWGERTLAFTPNWYAPFNMGQVSLLSSGWGTGEYGLPNNTGAPVPLTFGALRFSDVLRYRDLGPGTPSDPHPQQDDHGPVSDRTFLTDEAGVFGVLPMNQAVHKSDGQVPDLHARYQTSGLTGYGLFMPVGPRDTYDGNRVEKLTVNSFAAPGLPGADYGQVIGLGSVVAFSLDDTKIWFGAQGLSSYHLDANYPVELTASEFNYQSDCAIYCWFQMSRGHNLRIGRFGRSAFKALRSGVAYRNVFVAGVETAVSVVRLFECGSAQLDNWSFDFEGSGPSDSYVWASLQDDVGGTQLVIRDCVGVHGSARTAAVRLDSHERGAGLNDSRRRSGWCTIERSFNTYLDSGMQAVVAVDGPVWRGLYGGVLRPYPPLVVNTATPGASARIGTDSVPPPRSAPPLLPAGADDPVLELDGLIGYYRADASPRPVDPKQPLVDGSPVPRLVDLSPAHHDGNAVGNLALYETPVINGLPALRFAGGWYQFPTLRGTTGAATVFLVGKRLPAFDTGPNRIDSLHTYGSGWLLSESLRILSAESTTEWAVYAVRCTSGPRRVLQSFVNGYSYEVRRRDAVRPVTWEAPVLGSRDDGKDVFQGLLGTAIVCDAALSDRTISDTCRYLLHRYQIPV
ncbi:hypothetical protein [Streptomyces sp. NRRL B-1347]|uniref:hypothetical protein n=1 Tax=Streptomyces sp. NRRL B-1347 TaxID=1476877 RepID=UPI00131E918D|nr:hypothetical protein [Streptomyces sp. NRRL B-1347]